MKVTQMKRRTDGQTDRRRFNGTRAEFVGRPGAAGNVNMQSRGDTEEGRGCCSVLLMVGSAVMAQGCANTTAASRHKHIEELQYDVPEVKKNVESLQQDVLDMKVKGIAASTEDPEYASKNQFDGLNKFGFKAKSLREESVWLAKYKTTVLHRFLTTVLLYDVSFNLNIVIFCPAAAAGTSSLVTAIYHSLKERSSLQWERMPRKTGQLCCKFSLNLPPSRKNNKVATQCYSFLYEKIR